MRGIIVLLIVLLSFSAFAADCKTLKLTTSNQKFMTDEKITLWLNDNSVRCRDDDECFENYVTAELLIPDVCSENTTLIKYLLTQRSVLYEPWIITCSEGGNYTLKVAVINAAGNCEEEMNISIAQGLSITQTSTATKIDRDATSVTYIPIEQAVANNDVVKNAMKKDDNHVIMLLLGSIALILMLIVLLVIAAIKRKRPINKKITDYE